MTPTPRVPAEWLRPVAAGFAPPPKLSLSDWADKYYRLSTESSAEPGQWKTRPYQREIMDAMTDLGTERVSLMKSARVGATLMINGLIGYHIDIDPTSILMVQPNEDIAKRYTKEFFKPMMRDCPRLAEVKARKGASTVMGIYYENGAVFSLTGARAPSGLSSISRRLVLKDETDRWPPSAGTEGDPGLLADNRAKDFYNRKIVNCSTPGNAGVSRIAKEFDDGDQRYFYVPCPQCGHMSNLVFRESDTDGGHWMEWPDGEPERAHFVCNKNGCIIEEDSKDDMVTAGEWRARKEFDGHASFHIWAAYSSSPNATWGQIAAEFLKARKDGPEELKTFVNTTLGETWKVRGEAPDWEKLYTRRERYPIGSVPEGVVVVTCGVDVQQDYLIYEVVGWGLDKQSWSIEIGEIPGSSSLDATWGALDKLLLRSFPGAGSHSWPIRRLAVDSGAFTQSVYGWTRRQDASRVIAVQGSDHARVFVSQSRPTDISLGGRTIKAGTRYWPLAVSLGKTELYGWLRLPQPAEGEPYPGGWCHHPEYGQDYFRQLTAEQQVEHKKANGFTELRWMKTGPNHLLDCRIYARAAAASLGLDRMAPPIETMSRPPTKPASPQKPRWIDPGRRRGGWITGR